MHLATFQVSDVNLDSSELIVHFHYGRRKGSQKVPYSQIEKIRFKDDTVKVWFRKKKVKTVEIYVKGDNKQVFVISDRSVKPFESTSAYLKKISNRHNVPIEEEKLTES